MPLTADEIKCLIDACDERFSVRILLLTASCVDLWLALTLPSDGIRFY